MWWFIDRILSIVLLTPLADEKSRMWCHQRTERNPRHSWSSEQLKYPQRLCLATTYCSSWTWMLSRDTVNMLGLLTRPLDYAQDELGCRETVSQKHYCNGRKHRGNCSKRPCQSFSLSYSSRLVDEICVWLGSEGYPMVIYAWWHQASYNTLEILWWIFFRRADTMTRTFLRRIILTE